MKTTGKLIGVLVVIVAAAIVSFFYFNRPTATVSYAEQPVEIAGSIDAQSSDVNVKVPGKVARVLFDEGQDVKAGQVIAVMEAANLMAKKDLAKAALEAATAQYQKAKKGARPQQLAQANDLMEQAKVAYDLSKSNYDRYEQLYNEGVLPEQKLEMAKTDLEVSQARYNSAREQYNLVLEGAQKEDIAAAAALVEQAKAAGNEVQSYIDDSNVKAPISGVVTMKAIDEGEMVSSGMPIATITDLNKVWLEVKVRETALNQLHMGQILPIKVLGVPGRVYQGKVTYIAAKPSYATERAAQEKGEKDLVSFAVKIKLSNDDGKLRPGMTGTIRLKP